MAKRIDIDLLKVYDKEMRTKAMILQRNFDYSLDDIVRWGNVKLKCTTAGKTNSTAIVLTGKVIGDTVTDGTCVWELVDPNAGGGGGINRWKASENYQIDDVVLCSSEVNTNEWASNTSYAIDDIVVYGSLVYKCITANSDTTFDIDKWELVREVYTVLYRCITNNNDSTFDEVKWEQIGGSGSADIEELFA